MEKNPSRADNAPGASASDSPFPSGRGAGGVGFFAVALLWALYFQPLVLHPTQTLYAPYSDHLAEHLPAKVFLNREWRASGELPLWNPYHFCGSPFVHDIQVGMFYPPNLVVLLVPESSVGAVTSWIIALHVLAAGVFALRYARSHNLNQPASLVVAVGFMLSSKWMTHLLLAGHSVTAGLAWLPLLLFLVERAIQSKGLRSIGAAGGVLALIGLGTHPQWALYAGVFALAWTFPRDNRRRWLTCWAGAVLVAGLLSAVQLLPTWEASQWSARSGGLDGSGALSVGLHTALNLLGPSLSNSPPHSWEMQGVFGVFWLAAACAAPVLVGNRAKWQFGVLCGLFVFALGGAALLDWLPGFNLFRVPTRMLLIATFPFAWLAGTTTQVLTEGNWAIEARGALARGFRRVVLFLGLPTILGLWFNDGRVWWAFVAYWTAAVLMLPLFIRVLQNNVANTRTRTALWLLIVLVDLVCPVAVLPQVKPQQELYPSSPALEHIKGQPQPVRALDWDVNDDGSSAAFLGIGAPQSMVHSVGTPRGYNPLDVRHYREFLAFVVNDDRPIKGNSPYTQQVMPNFEVGNPRLFELLRVTHHIAPVGVPRPQGEWREVLTDPAPPAVVPLMPGAPPALPPHTLREAAKPQPRAWIVPRAQHFFGEPLPALKSCDFGQTVLVPNDTAVSAPEGTQPGTARITEYRPNRVTVELDGSAGWLVLSEVWFPGWTCRVDGAEVEVVRANHAFRAIPVSTGAKVAEFRFEPRSYRVGWWVSAASLLLILGTVLVGSLRAARGAAPRA